MKKAGNVVSGRKQNVKQQQQQQLDPNRVDEEKEPKNTI